MVAVWTGGYLRCHRSNFWNSSPYEWPVNLPDVSLDCGKPQRSSMQTPHGKTNPGLSCWEAMVLTTQLCCPFWFTNYKIYSKSESVMIQPLLKYLWVMSKLPLLFEFIVSSDKDVTSCIFYHRSVDLMNADTSFLLGATQPEHGSCLTCYRPCLRLYHH